MTDRPSDAPTKNEAPVRSRFLETMGAVAWSFFGVRKARDHESKTSQLNPVHVVIAGIAGAAVFVGGLLVLVNWVLSSGVAK